MLNILTNISFIILNLSKNGSVQKFGIDTILPIVAGQSYKIFITIQAQQLAAKNPTKPHFNHYLFEALSLSIRIVCTSQPTAVSNFEQVLFPGK